MRRFYGLLVVGLAASGLGWSGAGRAAETTLEVVIEPTAEESGATQDKAPGADGQGTAVAAPGAPPGPGAPAGPAGAGSKAGRAKDVAGVNGVEHAPARFTEFCAGWVDKLRERERYNLDKVKWEPAGDGVVAEYVGYDTKNVGPRTVEHLDATPIGKLVYLELKLRRAGKSKEEALAREPEIVERTEVLEIFRYERGSWVY